MDCQQVNRIIRVDGSLGQEMGSGETVTISLEDAAQIILQEQVMDGTLQIPPGTYHILTQDTLQVDENRLIVAGSDGMPVIMQSSSDNLQNYTVHTEDSDANISEVVNTVVSDGTSMDILQVGEPNEDLQLPQQTSLVAAAGPVTEDAESAEVVGVGVSSAGARDVKAEDTAVMPMELTNDMDATHSTKQGLSEDQSNEITESYSSVDNAADVADTADTAAGIQSRKPDLTCPIAVTERTEVVINGKKCLMMLNSETGQMCAYPLLPPEGRRKRGRPRKQPRLEEPPFAEAIESPEPPLLMPDNTIESTLLPKISLNGSQEWTTSQQKQSAPDDAINEIPLMSQEMLAQTEQTNAAEGLLELSATGPDGVRRSGRIRRKAKTLEDYEILEISSEDEGATAPDDEEVTPAGVKRKRTGTKEANTLAPFLLGPGMKRGRGRPRRYPPAGQNNLPTQIPAVIIPTSTGQTLMMASVPGIQNMQAFQQQIKQLPTFIQKSVEGQGIEDNNSQMLPVSLNTEGIAITTDSTLKQQQQQQQQQQDNLVISATTDSTTQNTKPDVNEDVNEEISNVHSKTAENSTSQPVTSDEGKNVSESSIEVINSSAQPTIIQIPENFLPMFLPKKDPIKIGLKATENDLERLRCNKCQFQAYYQQQFQEHLSSNHPETVQKCKCCTYLSLDKTDLYNHFKENHPRCLCHVCGFTSEHAYVIKRHMMRHSADGCTCELCGKTYKDQYILKMHVKMVHLPAEVLYECTICAKKFTRKAHLKRHLRIHDPEKPYKCPHCEYRGCERSDISKHVLIHDEPKHICEVCGKAFRHIKNKELHVKRHKGQRDYKCGVCDFFGYTFTDIRKHIERKHSDMKTLVCDKCGQTFRNESLLIEHQKQKCEVTMIEQALTIATSTGTTEARIQIPTSLSVDGQHITIGSQQIPMDTSQQVNITVEQLNLTGNSEDGEITLTESNPLGDSEIAVASQTEQFEDIEDPQIEDSEDPGCVLTEGTEVSESVGEEGGGSEEEKQDGGVVGEERVLEVKELGQNLRENLMMTKHHITVPMSQAMTVSQMTFVSADVMTTSTMTPTTAMVAPVVGQTLSELTEGVVQGPGLALGMQVEEAEAIVATTAETVILATAEAAVATETAVLTTAAAAATTAAATTTTTPSVAATVIESVAEVTATPLPPPPPTTTVPPPTTATTTTIEVETAATAAETSESATMNETVDQQQQQQQVTLAEVTLTEVDPSSTDGGEPAANMVIS